eukprot:scaffold14166_cov64-Phaeocystis_antarctica.AAC.4
MGAKGRGGGRCGARPCRSVLSRPSLKRSALRRPALALGTSDLGGGGQDRALGGVPAGRRLASLLRRLGGLGGRAAHWRCRCCRGCGAALLLRLCTAARPAWSRPCTCAPCPSPAARPTTREADLRSASAGPRRRPRPWRASCSPALQGLQGLQGLRGIASPSAGAAACRQPATPCRRTAIVVAGTTHPRSGPRRSPQPRLRCRPGQCRSPSPATSRPRATGRAAAPP